MSFIIAHSLYVILFFNRIYFSSTNVNYPFINSQFALTEPLVYVSTIIFVVISFLLFIKIKMKILPKHD